MRISSTHCSATFPLFCYHFAPLLLCISARAQSSCVRACTDVWCRSLRTALQTPKRRRRWSPPAVRACAQLESIVSRASIVELLPRTHAARAERHPRADRARLRPPRRLRRPRGPRRPRRRPRGVWRRQHARPRGRGLAAVAARADERGRVRAAREPVRAGAAAAGALQERCVRLGSFVDIFVEHTFETLTSSCDARSSWGIVHSARVATPSGVAN
jgi:hypothetical protein